jgi:hypothetical protein
LLFPAAIAITSLACKILLTPWVIEYSGVLSRLPKILLFSFLFSSDNLTTWVSKLKSEYGSLNPICPFSPKLKICKSIGFSCNNLLYSSAFFLYSSKLAPSSFIK